ncbi:hypothetical protein PDE_03478 [Penicillium oxalicum 114-2]|uniref:Uncharacterized protein n=1 Tax=Penicillium oxalicum (strain 114-2 / CGMCC 5302) TaxID=933388 RepID=S8B294_PENO1|nr:hypothetical protein PDE_03478 [Penicillium oxalicum 114-2]
MKKCHEKAERGFANCITSNCSGDGKSCYDACRGDAMCMDRECPSLGVECINSCGCVKAIDRIDCVASSCWNQVYSCEYQKSAQDVMNLCLGFDMPSLPFWPTPSDAPGGCSCNLGNVTRQETLISSHLAECRKNQTNLDQFHSQEAIWNTCPNTIPSEIGADYWYDSFLKPNHWDECASYLETHDCAHELGYSAESAGGTNTFYKPGKLPQNGTQSLFNTGQTLSTPASGASFTWTDGSLIHAITAASFREIVKFPTEKCHTFESPTSLGSSHRNTWTGTWADRLIQSNVSIDHPLRSRVVQNTELQYTLLSDCI